jgi:hypothetical protein
LAKVSLVFLRLALGVSFQSVVEMLAKPAKFEDLSSRTRLSTQTCITNHVDAQILKADGAVLQENV